METKRTTNIVIFFMYCFMFCLLSMVLSHWGRSIIYPSIDYDYLSWDVASILNLDITNGWMLTSISMLSFLIASPILMIALSILRRNSKEERYEK